ncbi:MAG: hypothetical protein PHX08_25465 [Lachnospiraceae bacterium]|nr:hypothetical protein [Lachnospiraceae bacterium]
MSYTWNLTGKSLIVIIALIVIFFTSLIMWRKKKGKPEYTIPIMIVSALFLVRYLWGGIQAFQMLLDMKASSVSVIGGVDGPTSIFLAGKIAGPKDWQIAVGGILLAVLLWWLIRRKNKNRE